MNDTRVKDPIETTIPPGLVSEYLESLISKGNHFGVIEIHIERKIVRVKNRQTYLKADLEELVAS